MEDLLMGSNDWRNIQDVVRQSFKALHSVARGQGEKIRLLEQRLGNMISASELESLQVSMSNKPTFSEVTKLLNNRFDELNITNIRSQLNSKADKADLKELYSDMTMATQRIGDGSTSLELLVRQQQSEIEALKREVRKLNSFRKQEEEVYSKFATRKWVEECVEFEGENRKQNLTTVKKELLDKFTGVVKKMEQIPSVTTLDEVFSQKVDMDTLTNALQDRPTNSQLSKEVAARVNSMANVIYEQTGVSIREAMEAAIASATTEISKVEDQLATRASRGELLELCGSKVDVSEFEERLSLATESLATEVKQAVVGIQKELVSVLNKKAFKADVQKLLQAKANVEDVQAWLSTKVEVADVRDTLSKKADAKALHDVVSRTMKLEKKHRRSRKRQSRRRHDISGGEEDEDQEDRLSAYLRSDFDDERSATGGGDIIVSDSDDEEWKYRVTKRIKQLSEDKASVKDICLLLDRKANIEDVNSALAEFANQEPFHSTHRPNVDEETMSNMRRDVNNIADAINAELSTGRWIWSSGRALSDRAVPWNIECINTATDNFMWKKDASDITTVIPGLYEISLGFFSETDPEVQILINGEPILYTSQKNNPRKSIPPSFGTTASSYRKTASYGPVLRRAKHSAGNITGFTMIDFVALPARARMTILYDGEMGAQGFLGLRKL